MELLPSKRIGVQPSSRSTMQGYSHSLYLTLSLLSLCRWRDYRQEKGKSLIFLSFSFSIGSGDWACFSFFPSCNSSCLSCFLLQDWMNKVNRGSSQWIYLLSCIDRNIWFYSDSFILFFFWWSSSVSFISLFDKGYAALKFDLINTMNLLTLL